LLESIPTIAELEADIVDTERNNSQSSISDNADTLSTPPTPGVSSSQTFTLRQLTSRDNKFINLNELMSKNGTTLNSSATPGTSMAHTPRFLLNCRSFPRNGGDTNHSTIPEEPSEAEATSAYDDLINRRLTETFQRKLNTLPPPLYFKSTPMSSIHANTNSLTFPSLSQSITQDSGISIFQSNTVETNTRSEEF